MNPSSEPNPGKEPAPPSIWKRPWRGPGGAFAWFALVVVASFVAILAVALGTNANASRSESVLLALVASAALAVILVAAFWLIPWLCRWRNLRRVLFVLGSLATLIALFYAEENWRGQYQWRKYRRAWEAKGEKFDLTDFAPAPVPDARNFALTPLLKPVIDYTNGSQGIVWRDTNGLAHLEKLSAYLGSQSGADEPALGILEKGTFADLTAWARFYRGNTNYPQPAATATPAETILTALGRFDPDLKELRDAAVSRPECRFPVHYGDELTWGILLPHLARLKGLTILTCLHATAELDAGHSDEALADLKLGWQLSGCIRSEPFLISHLVRIATLQIDLQTVREGLLRHAWTDSQLAELESYLAGLDLLGEYEFAMRGERACTLTGLDYLRRQGFRGDIISRVTDDTGGSDSAPPLNLMPGGWICQNMLTIARMHQDFTLPAVDGRTHRVFPEVTEAGDRAVEKMRLGPYTVFAKMLLPALGKAVLKSARMQTFVDATRVACALERYRLTNGKLPGNLESLVPKFLASVPNDVIDGKPLRYRPQAGGGYLLYSIGWNQTDDGGEVVFRTEKPTSRVDITKGDWVWKMPGALAAEGH